MGSLSLLQWIFSTQESNPGLLHCRQILNQLCHQGSPESTVNYFRKTKQEVKDNQTQGNVGKAKQEAKDNQTQGNVASMKRNHPMQVLEAQPAHLQVPVASLFGFSCVVQDRGNSILILTSSVSKVPSLELMV